MCKKKFELKQEHIDLISELNFKGLVSTEGEEFEYRPTIDYKRPFGNSGVTYDVLQKLGFTDGDGMLTEREQSGLLSNFLLHWKLLRDIEPLNRESMRLKSIPHITFTKDIAIFISGRMR